MEITNKIKSIVFAPYIGQLTYYDYTINRGIKRSQLRSVSNDGSIMVWDEQYKCLENNPECKLILKPLSDLTNEDATKVSYLIGYDREYDDKIQLGKKFIDDVFINNGCYLFTSILIVTQYLQSKGYDLPNYLLGGKTLGESGLSIYE